MWVSSNLGIYRKKYITSNWKKLTEAFLFAVLTSSSFYAGVVLCRNICNDIVSEEQAEFDEVVRFTCPEGKYNTLATLTFNTEGGIIRTLLRLPVNIALQGNNVNNISL